MYKQNPTDAYWQIRLQQLTPDEKPWLDAERNYNKFDSCSFHTRKEVLGLTDIKYEEISEHFGTLIDLQPGTEWSGLELESLAPIMQTAAQTILTPKQFIIFNLWLQGNLETAIARITGNAKRTIQNSLNGRIARRQQGVLNKMTKALKENKEYQAKVEQIIQNRTIPTERSKAIFWFQSSKNKPEQFVPLTVLYIADLIADQKRLVSFQSLLELLPRHHVEPALHWLRGAGYILWDGFNAQIINLPQEQEQE